MAQVEVGLGAVVEDVDLAVLVRAHRAGIDVDVGVELLQPDPQAAMLEQHADRGAGQPLAERTDHAAGDEDVFALSWRGHARPLTSHLPGSCRSLHDVHRSLYPSTLASSASEPDGKPAQAAGAISALSIQRGRIARNPSEVSTPMVGVFDDADLDAVGPVARTRSCSSFSSCSSGSGGSVGEAEQEVAAIGVQPEVLQEPRRASG